MPPFVAPPAAFDAERARIRGALGAGPDPTGMPALLRAQMEQALGADLSDVEVHPGSTRAEALGAFAFTRGSHIHVAPGQWAPETLRGRELLGHEVAHVVQQREGRVRPTAQRDGVPINDDPALEAEARALGARAARLTGSFAPFDAAAPLRAALGRSAPAADGAPAQCDDNPSAAHAGGAMGERDAAFALAREQGLKFVIAPGGAGGHKLTTPGLDLVGISPTGELWIIDNKASGSPGKVQDASAIVENLVANVEAAIAHVKSLEAFPEQGDVIAKLETTASALRAGKPVPAGVRVVITNAGGYVTGIGSRLAARGIQFQDTVGPSTIATRKADIRKAKAADVAPGRPVTKPAPAEKAPAPAEKAPPPAEQKPLREEPPPTPTLDRRESERVAASIGDAVHAYQTRVERVNSAALLASMALDKISNALAEWGIERETRQALEKRQAFISRAFSAGHGVFVVVRVEQWKIADENGNRVRVFSSMHTIEASSFAEGKEIYLGTDYLEPSRGFGWEPVSRFFFIPPP
jgi:hypothetical protein